MRANRTTGRLNQGVLPPCDTRPIHAGCMAFVCDVCGYQTAYLERVIYMSDGTPLPDDCVCGERRWLFPCEVDRCSDKTMYDEGMYG